MRSSAVPAAARAVLPTANHDKNVPASPPGLNPLAANRSAR